MEVNDIGSTFNVSEFDWNGAKVKEEEDEGYEGIQVFALLFSYFSVVFVIDKLNLWFLIL